MPKKKEGEASSPGKAQCSSVGKYQDREAGRGGLQGEGRGLMGLSGKEIQERGNCLKCK